MVNNVKIQSIDIERLRVGKFTLESLTTGMYSDPLTIFREYIQNACDSIDIAVKNGVLKSKICQSLNDNLNGKIHIRTNSSKKEITIRDNGIGVPWSKAWNVLGNIGKSEKLFEEHRGFRGIGRLGGMSYCDELIFETSFFDEEYKTIIKWNCKELRDFLRPGEFEEHDLIDVMESISSITKEKVKKNEHYFEVKLINVNSKYPVLLDETQIISYISQNAPVPFNPQQFIYAKSIKDDFVKFGYTIPEYSIFLNDDPNRLTKPYKSLVVARRDKEKDKHHHIVGYDIVYPISKEASNLFIGWVGKREKYDETVQIKDKEVSGIRLRKGNLQIGNNEILKDYFREDRQTHYFIGEIHILSNNVIPNARRDNFEMAENYPIILDDLKEIAKTLSKRIRENSDEKSFMKEVTNAEELIKEINNKAKSGFTSRIQQDELFTEVDEVQKKLKKITEKKNVNEKVVNEAKEKIDAISKLDNIIINGKCDNFILKTVSTKYSRKEKKIICRIFEILDTLKNEKPSVFEDLITIIKERILEELN